MVMRFLKQVKMQIDMMAQYGKLGSSWNDNMARLPHKGASWIDRGEIVQ